MLKLNNYIHLISKRYVAQISSKLTNRHKIKSWSVHSYGDIKELQLSEEARLPVIRNPDEVLVKVLAASLNPIDRLMLGGYGRTLFQLPRNFELEFPLTLGRDFSGTIVAKGHNVNSRYKIGDDVYGFIPIHKQGAFAEAILAEKCHILHKPQHLSHEESASLVYATMTAWSALFITGNLLLRQRKSLRVLVLGASGGVGTAAVQLLKSQGCAVFGSCSSDAVPLVKSLGADLVYDRNDPNYEKLVELEGKYHIILDAAKVGVQNIPSTWKYETYITLNSPLLINTDQYGLVGGLLCSANNILTSNIMLFPSGKTVRWGFFVPSSLGFEFINQLIHSKQIKPIVHKKFSFEDLPSAFTSLQEGHLRGKIVINYDH